MKTSLPLWMLMLVSGFLSAQPITLDLAKGQAEQQIPINTEVQTIVLTNVLYSSQFKYTAKVQIKDLPIPAFPTSVFSSGGTTPDTCLFLNDKIQEAETLTEESTIPTFKEELRDSIKKAGEAACTAYIERARKLLEHQAAIALAIPITLKECQELTITVTRTTNSNGTKKDWTFKYKTPCESPWKIHYGFTFSPNMMNPVNNYYAQSDTGSTYVISKLNNQSKSFLENLTPTVMFTYSSPNAYSWKKGTANYYVLGAIFNNNVYRTGITGGVGINLESPVVIIGPSIVIKENLTISAGMAVRQKSVLKGQYTEGQRLNETLDFDQLHEEKYMPEWYISIGFRFDQNPFSKKEEEKPTEVDE